MFAIIEKSILISSSVISSVHSIITTMNMIKTLIFKNLFFTNNVKMNLTYWFYNTTIIWYNPNWYFLTFFLKINFSITETPEPESTSISQRLWTVKINLQSWNNKLSISKQTLLQNSNFHLNDCYVFWNLRETFTKFLSCRHILIKCSIFSYLLHL